MPNVWDAMTITTVSSREFNQAASKVKRAANKDLVFITDRGRPAHVAPMCRKRNGLYVVKSDTTYS